MLIAMTPMSRRILFAIALLSCTGIIVSSVSLYHHYSTSRTSYCDFGNTFNCDIVNRSIYSTVLGIPVALIGVCGYLFLLMLSTIFRTRRNIPKVLLLTSFIGLSFALYLTYIEAYVLAVWCILCLSSLGTIVLITLLSLILAMHSREAA